VTLNGVTIPKAEDTKYLGFHLDKRLTWRKHIHTKRKQLKCKLHSLYWMLKPKSRLSLDCKLLIYKMLLKPIWLYGIQLWGTAANSNINVIQRFQSKTLRLIANAPFEMTNEEIHEGLEVPWVKEVICTLSKRYETRLSKHINPQATVLMMENYQRRLKRKTPSDLCNFPN